MSKIIEKVFGPLSPKAINRINALPAFSADNPDLDEFGFSREGLKSYLSPLLFLYEKWFRVETEGIENIPDSGPAIIVPNHSGQLPMDGAMIIMGCLMEKLHPRVPRALIEKLFPTIPLVSTMAIRCGEAVGVIENAERLLSQGELLMIFPEGVKGSGKLWAQRYQMQKFNMGFLELAIRFKAPIIPAAVIGSEEQAPSFYNVKPVAKALGLPYFPITPFFPWFGLLGVAPLPSKYRIYFGKPMDFSSHTSALDDPVAIRLLVESVRCRVQKMVDAGLGKRPLPGF